MFRDASKTSDLFRSESVLTSEYTPQKPVAREKEIDQIADALRPLTHRSEPINVLAHGPAGVGKSTCVEYVFDKLTEETRVKPISINCWQYNTRSSLLTELLINVGYPAPRKGKPVDELLAKLSERASKNRGLNAPKGYVIALDEFDQLEAKSEIIYDIERLNERTDTKFGLVMLSNQHPSRLQIEPRSRSRSQIATIQFEPYTTKELKQILLDRAEQAFQPGVVDKQVLEDLADTVANNTRDCRQAIHLLRQAGRKAEQQSLPEVTEKVLEKVLSQT